MIVIVYRIYFLVIPSDTMFSWKYPDQSSELFLNTRGGASKSEILGEVSSFGFIDVRAHILCIL